MAAFSVDWDEVQALLRLGGPMVATQFFIMAMGFLDTAMAGHYQSVDLAGVALGGNILWPVFMFVSGLVMALTPIVAQYRGAGTVEQAGSKIRQGIWIALFCSLLCVLIMRNAGTVYRFAGVDVNAAEIAVRYLLGASWGIPAVLLYVTLRNACEGLGKTIPPMLIAASALPLNGLLNYMLIYGNWGAPELGGAGAGWATAIVFWFELGLILLVLRAPYFRATGLLSKFDLPSLDEITSILKIGLPIGVTIFIGMALFSVIGILVGSLGVTDMAAHTIAGNINWATYVMPMAFGTAASIRVGYYVGAKNFDQSRRVAKTALLISFAYAIVISVVLILSRDALVSVYSTDPEVLKLAASLLLFIAFYQLFDDTQATMQGSLRGFKDTRIPMVFSLMGYWCLALPLGTALGFGWFGITAMGVQGFWIGLTVGLAVVCCCNALRLYSTSRNDARIARFAAI